LPSLVLPLHGAVERPVPASQALLAGRSVPLLEPKTHWALGSSGGLCGEVWVS